MQHHAYHRNAEQWSSHHTFLQLLFWFQLDMPLYIQPRLVPPAAYLKSEPVHPYCNLPSNSVNRHILHGAWSVVGHIHRQLTWQHPILVGLQHMGLDLSGSNLTETTCDKLSWSQSNGRSVTILQANNTYRHTSYVDLQLECWQSLMMQTNSLATSWHQP